MSDTAYVYCGSLYCAPCGERLVLQAIREDRKGLRIRCVDCGTFDVTAREARKAFKARSAADWLECPKCSRKRGQFEDEDSDAWPQTAPDAGGESDSPQCCDHCHEPLGNDLTSEGVGTLRDMLAEAPRTEDQKALHERWREIYRYALKDGE